MRDPVAVEAAPAADLPLTAAFRDRIEKDLARLRTSGGAVLARAEAIQSLAGTVEAILAADDSESAAEA